MPLKRALARTIASAFDDELRVTPRSLENPQGAQALICISVVCFSVYLFYECLYIAF